MKRLVKQLLYAMLFIVVVGIIIFSGYQLFGKPPESCFDKKQNQDEAGIDCGGMCGGVCFPQGFKSLSATNARAIPISGVSHAVSIVARVENPNAALAAREFSYEISLYDDTEHLLKTLYGSSFIYAGEFKYLVMPNVSLQSTSTSFRAEVLIYEPEWVTQDNFPRLRLILQNSHTERSTSTVEVSGTIFNQESVSIRRAYVTVLLVNQAGVMVGASETVLEDIASNETREFIVRHPPLSIDPSRTQVFISGLR